MEKKVLSLLLVFVMVFMFVPVIPVTMAEAAPVATGTSGVTFTTNSQINLKNPTDLVFRTDDYAVLESNGYSFEGLFVENEDLGRGNNLGDAGGLITYLNGVLTLPAVLFGQHGGNYPLQAGKYRADISFIDGNNDRIIYSVYFNILSFNVMSPSSPSSPSSSGGSDNVAAVVESMWLERGEAQQLASKAKAKSNQSVHTARTGKYGVRGNAWDRLTGLRYYHDTRIDNDIQVRLYINEPLKMKKDTLVSAYVAGGWVEITKSKFENYFKNKLKIVHFDQQTDWEQAVRVAVKLDFTKMGTKNLHFYAYNKNTNTYRRIDQPAYRIDKNGYLYFTTPFAGDIIISENSLERK